METAVCFTRALYSIPRAESQSHLAGANLVGSDLYNKLSDYFIRHFQGMLQVSIYLILPKQTLTDWTFRKQRY